MGEGIPGGEGFQVEGKQPGDERQRGLHAQQNAVQLSSTRCLYRRSYAMHCDWGTHFQGDTVLELGLSGMLPSMNLIMLLCAWETSLHSR